MRDVRSRQLRSKGPRTNRSPTRNATAATAMKASSCWRFLMFTATSWFPAEIETELQRRPAAAPEVIDFELGHFPGVAQLFEHFQKRLVVSSRAGTGDGGKLEDLEGLGGDHTVGRKGLRQLAQDAEGAEGFVEPGPVFSNLLL